MKAKDIIGSVRDWYRRFQGALAEESFLGREPFDSLLVELNGYVDLLDDPTISDNLNNFKLVKAHPIDVLGCGLAVTRLYEQGLDARQIATQLTKYTREQIAEEQVRDWLEKYQTSPISQQRGKTSSSIFDTANQLEMLCVQLTRIVSEVEAEDDQIYAAAKTTRHQVKTEVLREMRATIKDAYNIVKAAHEMNNTRELANWIVEVVGEFSPEIQRKLYKRLKEQSVLFRTLGL